jgi:hypothetical protein
MRAVRISPCSAISLFPGMPATRQGKICGVGDRPRVRVRFPAIRHVSGSVSSGVRDEVECTRGDRQVEGAAPHPLTECRRPRRLGEGRRRPVRNRKGIRHEGRPSLGSRHPNQGAQQGHLISGRAVGKHDSRLDEATF